MGGAVFRLRYNRRRTYETRTPAYRRSNPTGIKEEREKEGSRKGGGEGTIFFPNYLNSYRK